MDQFRGLQCEFERFPLDQRCRVPLVGNGRGSAGRLDGLAPRLACRTASETIDWSTPVQPAMRRTYSERRIRSGIDPITGAAARKALVRPSALSRSNPSILDRITNSTNGMRPLTRSRPPRRRRRCAGRTDPSLTGHRHEGLPDELLVHVERAQSGLASRLVGVEREDDLAAVFVLIQQQATQHLDMLFAERGATGGHRSIDPARWQAITSV